MTTTQTPLEQLDRDPHQLTREHRRVLDLSQFRRHLTTVDQRPLLDSADPADTPCSESRIRHELNLAFTDLGAAAFALANHGTLTDLRLAPRVQHIHNLYAQLDRDQACRLSPHARSQRMPGSSWNFGGGLRVD
jgi:hypothetical protein